MIPITINDQQFEISPDLSVLEAARENGMRISTLCCHAVLKAIGEFWVRKNEKRSSHKID